MKILFLENSPLWIFGLPNGFKDEGHTVMISGPISRENILDMIRLFQPDLIISLGWTTEHTPEKARWIHDAVRRTGIPLIYWATEDPLHTKHFTVPLLATMKPDFVFTVTPSLCAFYEGLGVKAAPLEFAYHESVHHRVQPLDHYSCDIAVVANAYPTFLNNQPDSFRLTSIENLIFPLVQKNMRIEFLGRGWEQMGNYIGKEIPQDWLHGYLKYADAHKVYSSAKIIIGPQNCIDQLTMRTFEILGSGGFLLTSDTPAVREKFTPDRDLIVSSSPEETIDKVNDYLHQSEKREQIRENAKKAVERDSYRHRAQTILQELRRRGFLRKVERSLSGGEVIYYPNLLEQKYVIHAVRPGETLRGICERHRIPLRQIIELNRLQSEALYAGQILKIRVR